MDRHAVERAVVTGELAPPLRPARITPLSPPPTAQQKMPPGGKEGREEEGGGGGGGGEERNTGHLGEQRTA